MPPRSVLLNVSITSKALEKDRVVESVKEFAAQAEPQHGNFDGITPVMDEGKHERADSAVSVPSSPSFSNMIKSPNAAIAINTSYGIARASPSCAICEKSTRLDGSSLQHCSRCKSVYYCSKDCQKIHWPAHKRGCVPSNAGSRAVSTAPSPSSPSPSSTSEMLTGAESPSPAASEDAAMEDV